MSLSDEIHQHLIENLATFAEAPNEKLNNALRLLGKWRSFLIQNTFHQHEGTVVLNGPLKGLDFVLESAEGCHVAKLLGSYEQPLHVYIEQVIQAAYPLILNIGCAEGYYSVGMARRMPATQILSFDINPAAQQACAALAAKNQVSDRVKVGGLFHIDDFARYAGSGALLMCDIEGAERELLNPELAPALEGMDIIVESHDGLIPGTTALLLERFAPSHHIAVVEDNGSRHLPTAPAWFNSLAHLDQLLALWEWRSGPTPWLIMKAKSGAPV